MGHRHRRETTSDRKQGLGRAPELREASRKRRESTIREGTVPGWTSISMQSRWYVQGLAEAALTDANGEGG